MLILNKLEQIINYNFKNKKLLNQSIIHSSFYFNKNIDNNNCKNYERMEFLGDRVLGLVIAEYLINSYPDENQGKLNLRFVKLVRKESCALVASALNLDKFIILGANEKKICLNKNLTILGDVCEALIAALFLDGGIKIAKLFILNNWKNQFKSNLSHRQDAKTALQEWAQKIKLSLPKYKIIEISGPDHSPMFTIQVTINSKSSILAIGNSKRIAEQKAAKKFLLREKIWS